MYPWPTGDFDNTMDVALDTAMNYLEHTGQAQNFGEVQRVAAMAILAAWKKGERRPVKLANLAIQSEAGWRSMSWDHRFAEPIVLLDGWRQAWHPCARLSLTSLRPSPHPTAACRLSLTAAELLTKAGRTRRPSRFARIATLRAINRHVERVLDPTRKDTHWGRRKLARDRCEKATERLQRSATASRSWGRVLKSQLTRGFFTA
jgi:hypothetical protein